MLDPGVPTTTGARRRIWLVAAVAIVTVAVIGAGLVLVSRLRATTSLLDPHPTAPAQTVPALTLATVVVGVDLPFQGSSQVASDDTWRAMQLYLEQVGGRAGNYRVELKKYDNSTAGKGAWDEATCTKNANDHVANANEVAVMGTYNSGCAKREAPVLNRDPTGPMLMISHANSDPGLTKAWESGEPAKYFPSGKRSYGRVLTTDETQGVAAAQFAAKELGVKRCFVLDDIEIYGKGVADSFAKEAAKQGITVVGRTSWREDNANYIALFGRAKSAGADCVLFGGIFYSNGGQLTKDKVAVLGDNNAVKLLAPDGFTGYPDFLALAESDGAYLTFPGRPTESLTAAGGAPATFIHDYRAKYGSEPRTTYALYGVQALQVILEAIERSDGTRKGVRDQVFEGAGITIPANQAILGREMHIDPATGDTGAQDVSIEQVRFGQETFLAYVSV